MFTGIVEGTGTVVTLARPRADGGAARLQVDAPWLAGELAVGDSVAVDGCCLTVVAHTPGGFAADLVAETLRRTALGRLAAGARVNLERPLALGGRLGGHLVQGHVDGVGRVRRVTDEGLEIEAGPEILRYCVEKGSIAVEGVSLTIAALDEEGFTVALVPHTRQVTTLGRVVEGDELNLEVDMLAKYVEKLAAP